MNIRSTPILSLAVTLLVALAALNTANAVGAPSGNFEPQSLKGWKERSFEGNTRYKLVDEQGTKVLHGHTQSKASILYREKEIDLTKTPVISWSWKVDRTYTGINEQSREGDDYPARLYVAAKIGFLPWETIAINYVWASQTSLGESWTNPYTNKAIMVAVQSGDELVGQWTKQTRNIAEDFKRLYNRDIDEISGYAVMVDGDNSKQEANAWFGNIEFSGALE